MKVDIRKAYDSVMWDFLTDLLIAYKFPQRFLEWLVPCIHTVSYLLVLNGEATEWFNGKQGLRQGDPLSPLIFELVMEYLSRMLSLMANDAQFRFHPLCKSHRLTNLAFADDLRVFCKGDSYYVKKIAVVLEQFASVSGLQANLRKSSIYMGV